MIIYKYEESSNNISSKNVQFSVRLQKIHLTFSIINQNQKKIPQTKSGKICGYCT